MRWVTPPPPPPLGLQTPQNILSFLRSLYILCSLFPLITWIQIVLITLCPNNSLILHIQEFRSISWPSTVRAPVFGRHQFFGTSEHYRKAHGSLLFGWIDYNYRKGTSIRQAPGFRHLRALRKSPWQFIIWMNELLLHCMLLVSYILQYFNTSIRPK